MVYFGKDLIRTKLLGISKTSLMNSLLFGTFTVILLIDIMIKTIKVSFLLVVLALCKFF